MSRYSIILAYPGERLMEKEKDQYLAAISGALMLDYLAKKALMALRQPRG